MNPLPVSIHGLTHVGRVRKRNEDTLLACTLGSATRVWASTLESLPEDWVAVDPQAMASTEPVVLAVADGVGGGPGGKEASQLALRHLPRILRDAMSHLAGNQDPDGVLADAVVTLHHQLTDAAARSPELEGMATTLTVWIGSGDTAWLAQVGDSRCYRLRDGTLTQLSHDQTVAQDMVDQGMVRHLDDTPQIAQNILTSALGGSQLSPRVDRLDRRAGDVILVCSDGVMKHIPDDGIHTWLSSDMSTREIAEGIVDAAVEEGGHDNVSAIVARESG